MSAIGGGDYFAALNALQEMGKNWARVPSYLSSHECRLSIGITIVRQEIAVTGLMVKVVIEPVAIYAVHISSSPLWPIRTIITKP